ncbi:MAG: flagellar biosynthesis protein FlhF [Candidatus Glassbacteria bacterium]|nr:flagellar biosynthesis protein FlhF [Candidatus Glassbacteria bacterium]
MKVKKYTAPSMREALEKMKRDLGTGAVILGSRKISRGGLLDFIGKEMFEVTATTEDNVLVASPSAAKPGNGAEVNAAGGRVSFTVGDNGAVATGAKGSFGQLLARQVPPLPVASASPGNGIGRRTPIDSANVRMLQQELKDLRSAVGEMAEHMKYQRMPSLPPVLREVYKKLVNIELEERTAGDLIQKLYARFSEKQYNEIELVEKYLIEEITRMIPVSRPAKPSGKDPLIILFAGPSGVGKTTCLAKLATNKRFYGGHKVVMVTADTYRVAATQQLGTFSEIADIPLEIAHSPRDITRAVKRHQDKEVILIDTSGGSQFNDKMLSELKDFVTAAGPDEVHLVLSVDTKPRDLQHAIRRFRTGKSMRLLLTKFDETLTFGSIVGVARDAGIPISYLTFGQEVPEDIEPADAAKIAKLVVGNVF